MNYNMSGCDTPPGPGRPARHPGRLRRRLISPQRRRWCPAARLARRLRSVRRCRKRRWRAATPLRCGCGVRVRGCVHQVVHKRRYAGTTFVPREGGRLDGTPPPRTVAREARRVSARHVWKSAILTLSRTIATHIAPRAALRGIFRVPRPPSRQKLYASHWCAHVCVWRGPQAGPHGYPLVLAHMVTGHPLNDELKIQGKLSTSETIAGVCAVC
jgi:hypothetical protein